MTTVGGKQGTLEARSLSDALDAALDSGEAAQDVVGCGRWANDCLAMPGKHCLAIITQ